ncbi:MAG TPA: Ig-like domain-containing protein, partial [Geobacteraceae bacterium]|nr:Ig-like domain-containing protein [Geobacteraceae bacterium]
SGNASDAGGLKSVTVNDKAVTANPAGSFSTALTLASGANIVTVIATDKAGNQQTDTRSITYDPAAPVLAISAPADNSSTVQSFIDLTGTISDTSTTVTVTNNNGTPQNASINGTSFTVTANLAPGVNTIVITTSDLSGNTASAKRTVTYDSVAMTLAVTYPNQDITTSKSSLVLTGTIADALSKVTIRITKNGNVLIPPKVINGAFKKRLNFTKARTYAITITARDAAGNKSTVTRNVIYSPAREDDGHNDD